MPATQPIVVSENAGLIDTLTALGRYLVVIAGAVPILISLFGARDLIGVVNYFRTEDGTALAAAICAVATMLYGLWKTRRRGAQIAKVAGNSRVPDSIAQLK